MMSKLGCAGGDVAAYKIRPAACMQPDVRKMAWAMVVAVKEN